jgi:hypothetical protein
MAVIWAIILGMIGVLGAALSRQMADEFRAWSPWLVQRVVRYAVSVLPECERDRMLEEWERHVQDTPGDLSKFVVSIGFMFAARRIRSDIAHGNRPSALTKVLERALDLCWSGSAAVLIFALLVLTYALLYLEDPKHPPLILHERVGKDRKSNSRC